MSSLEKLVPRARLQMHSLQWHLKSSWSTENDPPHLPVPRSRQGHLLVDGEGPPPREDALHGTPPPPPPPPELRLYSGLWSNQETSLHINILEMKALFLPLRAFQDTITNQRVTAMCDNSTVVAYVSKQGGAVSDSLCELTGQLLRWTEAHNVLLEARYLPGQSDGSPQPPQPSTRCEVVPPPAGSEEDHPHLGVSDNRPIRNTPQREVAPVLLPNSRSSSRLQGRIPPPVKSPRRVRVSTLPFGREGSGQSRRDPKSLRDTDRPLLAGEVMVRRPPPPTDPTSPGVASMGPFFFFFFWGGLALMVLFLLN